MRKSVVVVGGGMMGCGIAAVASAAGNHVIVVETVESVRKRGVGRVQALHNELVENGLLSTKACEEAARNIEFVGELESACSEAYFVIEAIIEDLAAKQKLFAQLDQILPIEVPIVSNTSGLRITDIGANVVNKGRIATAHFWFPAHIVPLVEIVMSDNGTTMQTAESIKRLLLSWGKSPVIVKRDLPGQLANRILQAMIREASAIVESGLASAEDVDTAIKMGLGIRLPVWGILEHCDGVGLDLIYKVQNSVLPSISASQKACDYVEQLYESGHLGYKTGSGFYDWSKKDMKKLEKLRNDFIMNAVKMLRSYSAE